MSYPEPSTSFTNLSITKDQPQTILATDSQNTPLAISHYSNIGWEIEVRYDMVNKKFHQQPFTGAQEILKKDALSLKDGTKEIIVQTTLSSLRIDKLHGKISVLDYENNNIFETIMTPFSYHPELVSIYEHIMSTKVTDFSLRAPFAPKGELFETHMVRFQYPRPSGVVLGIPGQAGEANRNGYRFELYNTDDYLHIPIRNPLYQSWPILFHKDISNNGWICIFHDNPSRTFIDIGDFYQDKVTFESLTGNTRVYIIHGKTIEDVSHKLAALLGNTQLPPLWAFGYQQCRFSYMSTKELISVVSTMEKETFPLDAIYCDIDIFDDFRVFTKNGETFADFPKTSKALQKQGVHSVTIMDPGVKIDENFKTYTELKKLGSYLKNQDGTDFIGKVWPGNSLFPDFSDEKVQNWWAKLQKSWVEENNLSGVWNDMNEPSNFDGMTKKTSQSIWSHGPLKNEYNLYGYYEAQASNKGWKLSNPEKRGLIISRSGYPGIQQHAVIWHGDNCSWWEHLRLALQTALSYSLCGVYYTGADVPGFTGNPPDDLAIRFFQLGAFLPFFRGHSIFFAKDKEPYAFRSEAKKYIREAIHLRYSLLREWYSSFEQAIRTQQSPLLPVFDTHANFIPDHYTLFNKFLFAPVINRDEVKKLVYLPRGIWYRLGQPDEPISGDQWTSINCTLGTIPVFVKGGNILTRNTPGKNTGDTFTKKEYYETYKDEKDNATGYWFSDDGVTINDQHAKRYKLELERGKVIQKEI